MKHQREIDNIRFLTVNSADREYDARMLPDNVIEYLFDYGLRQVLNDSYASALDNVYPDGKTSDELKKMTESERAAHSAAKRAWGKDNSDAVNAEREKLHAAKWDRLAAGEIRSSGGGKAGLTPFEKKRYEIAREWLKAEMDRQGIDKKSFTKLDSAEQYEVLDGFIATNQDSIDKETQHRLDAVKKAGEAKIDISALLPKKA